MEALKLSPDFDPTVEEEIYQETAPDGHGIAEAPREWRPEPEDEQRAGRYLRAYRWHLREQARICRAAADERQRIDAWEAMHGRQEEQALVYLEHMLRLYLVHTGRRKVDLPSGSISWRKARERVEIADLEAFVAEHQDTELVRVKMEPDKRAVMDQVKRTGEIPLYAKIVRGEDQIHIGVDQ